MSFMLWDLHELRMALNAVWKQKPDMTSQPFPIKQTNKKPGKHPVPSSPWREDDLPACKAPSSLEAD